ncbi:riddle 1 L homeolog precursor [Xenopus laevis]|uniref:Riddle 1 n=2 Tax=Xenopus laevis TaxID=8355 RepID=Q8AXC3_XENLA|nr:riddle 1 L homeolog precursor [Xenopus laevis]AAO15686.1 Riddle 1 [Xenopus laevis]OCT73552.1 hypothetical protein XELAEV_18036531mg [Xenopus laevis]
MKRASAVFLICALALSLLCVCGTRCFITDEPAEPGSCLLNQVWKECGSYCPRDCQNINEADFFCPAACKRGCFCQPPYIFLSGTAGPCVLPRECP